MEDINDYLKSKLIKDSGYPTYSTRKAAIISSKISGYLAGYKDDMYLRGRKAFSWVGTVT